MNKEVHWPTHMGVVVCSHVKDKARPIRLVSHLSDGEWSFTCGQSDHSADENADDEYFWVGVDHLIHHDSSIAILSDLPKGWSAERAAIGETWNRFADPD